MQTINKAWDGQNKFVSPSESNDTEENEVPTIVLPSKFVRCSRTDLAILISRMLTFLIHINDNSSRSSSCDVSALTRFHSRVPPDISVYNYLIRLTKYSSLEHCVLISAVYYIDLLSSVYPTFALNSLTVHRFLLTATTVASKGLSDSFCTNSHYAKVGGVHCSELNILECEFLKKINYRILPRDDNINWCKLENKHHIFSVYKDLDAELSNYIPIKDRYSNHDSGYNVLNTYYKKMVQLVGSFSSSPDKSKVVNYTLPHFIQNINLDVKGHGKSSRHDNQHDNYNDDDSNIQPFTEAIDEANSSSRKRNIDIAATDDVKLIGNSSKDNSVTTIDEHQRTTTRSSSTKKHINDRRVPKIPQSIDTDRIN